MNVYRIADADTVIAESEADAWEAWEAATGMSRQDECFTDDDIRQLPADKPIHILPGGWDGSSGGKPTETHTAAEWAEREGRGFLCSSEW